MSRLTRLRAFSWLAVFDAARTTWSHFSENVSKRDRDRVMAILRKTKGDPRRLTVKDKADLRAIGRRLQLARLGRDLMPLADRARRGKKRR